MEGIKTADALLARTKLISEFKEKGQAKEARATIKMSRLKMDRIEQLFLPVHPVSLIVDPSKKI